MMPPSIELGLDTFGDVTFDAAGQPLSQAHVLRNVVEEAVLADQLGVDAFGVGEHHRRAHDAHRAWLGRDRTEHR